MIYLQVEVGGRMTVLPVATPLQLPQPPSSCWTVLQLILLPVRTDRQARQTKVAHFFYNQFYRQWDTGNPDTDHHENAEYRS